MADKFQDKIKANLRDAAKTDTGTGNLKKFKKNVVKDKKLEEFYLMIKEQKKNMVKKI